MSVRTDVQNGPGVTRLIDFITDWRDHSHQHLVLLALPSDLAHEAGRLIDAVARDAISRIDAALVEKAHAAGMNVTSSLRVPGNDKAVRLAKLTPFLQDARFGRDPYYRLVDGDL